MAASYPSYSSARSLGHEYDAISEKSKVEITDVNAFPAPVKRLNALLSSSDFLGDLEYITGIEGLLYDDQLHGGGMHLTGPRGRLDVHVDFNYEQQRKLHRRLNILIYFNEEWKDEWGGALELWDRDIQVCHRSVKPVLNRCVIFETSEISFHGVEPVTCPEGMRRISFAAYYCTAVDEWKGRIHTTIFKARPDERFRGAVLLPFVRARNGMISLAKSAVKKLIRH